MTPTGNRTCDLPSFSAVPQPAAHIPEEHWGSKNHNLSSFGNTFLFRKHSPYNKHLNVDGTSLVEHGDVAEAFEKYFQSVYNNPFGEGYFSGYLSSNFVLLPPISDLNILKTVKGLRLSKSVRLCGIPGFLYRSFPKY